MMGNIEGAGVEESARMRARGRERQRSLCAILNRRWWRSALDVSWVCDEVATLTRGLQAADPLGLCVGPFGAPTDEYEPEAIAFVMLGCGALPFGRDAGTAESCSAGDLNHPNVERFLSTPPTGPCRPRSTMLSRVEAAIAVDAPLAQDYGQRSPCASVHAVTAARAPTAKETRPAKSQEQRSADEIIRPLAVPPEEPSPGREATENPCPQEDAAEHLLTVCSTLFGIAPTHPAWDALRTNTELHSLAQACLDQARRGFWDDSSPRA